MFISYIKFLINLICYISTIIAIYIIAIISTVTYSGLIDLKINDQNAIKV